MPPVPRRHLGARFASEVDSTVNFAFNSRPAGRHRADRAGDAGQLDPPVPGNPLPGLRLYRPGRLGRLQQAAGARPRQCRRAYLSSQGISRSRLEALVSYGETRPVIATAAPERQNRRAVTEVSGLREGRTDAAERQVCAKSSSANISRAPCPTPNISATATATAQASKRDCDAHRPVRIDSPALTVPPLCHTAQSRGFRPNLDMIRRHNRSNGRALFCRMQAGRKHRVIATGPSRAPDLTRAAPPCKRTSV